MLLIRPTQHTKSKHVPMTTFVCAASVRTCVAILALLSCMVSGCSFLKLPSQVDSFQRQAELETLLVLDATIGQNSISQAKLFHEAMELDGLVMTKLDGTAKGGIIFSLCKQFGTPIRYVGLGEGVDDLQPFRAKDYVQALFDQDGKGY